MTLTTATFDNVIQLSCTATGNPPPAVAWQKKDSDGQFVPLPGKDGQWELVQKVIEVEQSDETYRCVANNTQGIIYAYDDQKGGLFCVTVWHVLVFIGHFRVAFCLCLKTSPGTQPLLWK